MQMPPEDHSLRVTVFASKLEAWLRFAHLPYRIERSATLKGAPKGQVSLHETLKDRFVTRSMLRFMLDLHVVPSHCSRHCSMCVRVHHVGLVVVQLLATNCSLSCEVAHNRMRSRLHRACPNCLLLAILSSHGSKRLGNSFFGRLA